MKIVRRIRSIEPIVRIAGRSKSVICGVTEVNRFKNEIQHLGLTVPVAAGESVLPAASFGKSCELNANGWIEKHTDQPMETAYRTVIWRWKMKRGWDYVWDEKVVDVPYQRYPRTEHPPIGLELRVTPRIDGTILLTLPEIKLGKTSTELQMKTAVNMLIELFGECTVFHNNLDELITRKIKHLNWRVLPPGKLPWDRIKKEVKEIIAREPEKVQEIIEYRLKVINGFNHTFVAIGQHGFAGYLIFGFPSKSVYVLESLFTNNATYGLGKDWETLSKLSKGELLNGDLHLFRLVHTADWASLIRKQLST